jgi:hypothetical protein
MVEISASVDFISQHTSVDNVDNFLKFTVLSGCVSLGTVTAKAFGLATKDELRMAVKEASNWFKTTSNWFERYRTHEE